MLPCYPIADMVSGAFHGEVKDGRTTVRPEDRVSQSIGNEKTWARIDSQARLHSQAI
jgi:hypothetical protein